MITVSLRCAKEHEQRADLAAEVANTSSGGGLVKSPKADFREAMRLFYDMTRSATRQWCSTACMNRARSLHHYRQAKASKAGGQ